MSAYGSLAPFYDLLTRDVDYDAFLELYEKIFESYGVGGKTVIDLACGTGNISYLMAQRGYEVIGVDASEEMLSAAAEKARALTDVIQPIFINQCLEELDLYGTANAAVCALDGINYISPELVKQVFTRIALFVEPGGVLVFDVLSPEEFESRDGEMYVDEAEDVYCVWQPQFDGEERCIYYGMDIFIRRDEFWERAYEEHVEYAHEPEYLKAALEECGFDNVQIFKECVPGGEGRMFFAARRKKR